MRFIIFPKSYYLSLSEKVESANITAGCKVMFLDMQLSLFEFVDVSDTDVALSFNDESLKNCL
tara:strand:+ start:237 stop:425 length:189 start_codon:yes stop_codon:yes gene_type:complete